MDRKNKSISKQVVCDSNLTDPFNVSTGVKQGCILSPFLFILAMDWIMKTSTDGERRGIRCTMTMTATTTLDDLDFADDIALLSHRHQDIQEKTKAFSETAGNLGLKVSTKKMKSMRVNARVQDSIKANGEKIEEVDSFTYLGSKMSNMGCGGGDSSPTGESQPCLRLTQEHMEGKKHQPEDQTENLQIKCGQHPPLRNRIIEDDQNHQ
ncbi:hypothetical protein C0Q70_12274 [Pomacea canaliculata]|uniref:Reverse transcriptase domain-containing protein n=1 Tax=Pomacea canaliculata TaxID=400727 RepID=A0A2T7P136_POMCA|nr:hypothetical protein C0Q70_12274 [Pomacea canaliculata]